LRKYAVHIFAKPLKMKPAFFAFASLFIFFVAPAQTAPQTDNIFIITTDGFRWQEVFTGADSAMISNTRFVQDTSLIKQLYWADDVVARRQKLMPFFWNVIAQKGQLYGNRLLGNKANAANLYKISYPGYNEIFTGFPDPFITTNLPRENQNINILEYLNNEKRYHGDVVAFSSWTVFPYILNVQRSGLPVNSGYENMENENADSAFQLIDKVQDDVEHKSHTRYDQLTFLNAREYIEQHHPKIVFIGLGETDEFAHEGHYDKYLQQANAIDKMISDLWYYVQTHSFYKNKTTFIITTDHGRGETANSWHKHSFLTKGSAQTWMAMIGPGIEPIGEMKTAQQVYQKQIASTIATLLGQDFKSPHRIGKPILLPQTSQPTVQLVSK
jgi:phosphopentomutase/2,3-bisphosphoglycerate-independent phosphoglycerate mutase family metalloenzyme